VLSVSATTIAGVFADIERVAAALGCDDEAEELVAGLRARLDAVHRALSRARAPRPRVAVVEWGEPAYAGGHWVPEMVRRAGGIDVLGVTGEPSTVFKVEMLAAGAPDIVLVAPCGHALDGAAAEARRLLALDKWGFLRGCDVWALDANALTSRPGPRLVDGVEAMARVFNPAVFTPLSEGRALRIHPASG
jgi:iron complex transport system substrate-binding protein